MKRIFRTLFAIAIYAVMALFVFTRIFSIEDSALGQVIALTTVSFFIGFIANLKGVILRPLALAVSLVVMNFVIAAPFGRWPDTDNFFFLAYGLGYIATPIANLKWNIIDKRIDAKKGETKTEH